MINEEEIDGLALTESIDSTESDTISLPSDDENKRNSNHLSSSLHIEKLKDFKNTSSSNAVKRKRSIFTINLVDDHDDNDQNAGPSSNHNKPLRYKERSLFSLNSASFKPPPSTKDKDEIKSETISLPSSSQTTSAGSTSYPEPNKIIKGAQKVFKQSSNERNEFETIGDPQQIKKNKKSFVKLEEIPQKVYQSLFHPTENKPWQELYKTGHQDLKIENLIFTPKYFTKLRYYYPSRKFGKRS